MLRGSRDGFVETRVSNAALLRRRIRDPRFSMELYGVGRRSRSDVAICYISDSVDQSVLNRMRKLIQSIDVDALTMNIESLAECSRYYLSFSICLSSGRMVHSIVIKHMLPPIILDTGSAANTPFVPILRA